MKNVAETFIRRRAERQLSDGKVVIFAAGTGNPFFSTDTTAALRASEMGADVILKATQVDGVYDSDPRKNPDAKRYENVTFHECISQRLNVMDATAFSLCMDNHIPIIVFDLAPAWKSLPRPARPAHRHPRPRRVNRSRISNLKPQIPYPKPWTLTKPSSKSKKR